MVKIQFNFGVHAHFFFTDKLLLTFEMHFKFHHLNKVVYIIQPSRFLINLPDGLICDVCPAASLSLYVAVLLCHSVSSVTLASHNQLKLCKGLKTRSKFSVSNFYRYNNKRDLVFSRSSLFFSALNIIVVCRAQ